MSRVSSDEIRRILFESLAPLAVARESHIETCAPIIEGVTHCESCGFSYTTPRHVVTHRGLCQTPDKHPEARA